MAEIIVNLVSTGEPDPAWKVTFPDGGNAVVPAEQEDTFNWAIGSAPIRAAISAITFALGQPGNVPWGGATPSAPDWSTTDVNTLSPEDPPVSWEYTVTITYQGIPYPSDPKITNQPPTVFLHQPPSRSGGVEINDLNR